MIELAYNDKEKKIELMKEVFILDEKKRYIIRSHKENEHQIGYSKEEFAKKVLKDSNLEWEREWDRAVRTSNYYTSDMYFSNTL